MVESKADFAIQLDDRWKENVMKITKFKDVDLVFDSVGSTLLDSFDVTKECGTIVFLLNEWRRSGACKSHDADEHQQNINRWRFMDLPTFARTAHPSRPTAFRLDLKR